MKKKKLFLLAEVFAVAFAIIIIVTISSPLFPAGVNINTPENFPDPNFRWAVERLLGVIPGGHFTAEQAAKASGTLNFVGMNVKSVKGIEYFKSITYLDATKNQLTHLDLSNQTLLKEIRCNDNQLSSFNLSQCPELISLFCDDNQLTELDMSNNPKLQYLFCRNNQLQSLNVSQNLLLTTLNIKNNKISELDISGNINLESVQCVNNQLQTLNIANLNNLKNVYLNGNPLKEIPEFKNKYSVYMDIVTESNFSNQ